MAPALGVAPRARSAARRPPRTSPRPPARPRSTVDAHGTDRPGLPWPSHPPCRGGAVIARTWKGAVRRRDGGAYARYMRQTGVAEYAQSPGNRGVWMLRRDVEDRTEFLMFTLWDSLEAVKGFAGEDYERAVFYPEDDRFLVERDRTSTHYEVDTERQPGPAMIGRLD